MSILTLLGLLLQLVSQSAALTESISRLTEIVRLAKQQGRETLTPDEWAIVDTITAASKLNIAAALVERTR